MEIRFTFHFVSFRFQMVGKFSLARTRSLALTLSLVMYFTVQLSLVPTVSEHHSQHNSSGSRATHGMPNIIHCIYFGQIHQMNYLQCSVTVRTSRQAGRQASSSICVLVSTWIHTQNAWKEKHKRWVSERERCDVNAEWELRLLFTPSSSLARPFFLSLIFIHFLCFFY